MGQAQVLLFAYREVHSQDSRGTQWGGASHGTSGLLEKQHKGTSPIQMTRQSAGVLVLIVRGL